MATVTPFNPLTAWKYTDNNNRVQHLVSSNLVPTALKTTAPIAVTGAITANAYESVTAATAAIVRTLPAGVTAAKANVMKVGGDFPVTVAPTAPQTINGSATPITLEKGRVYSFCREAGTNNWVMI